MSNLQNERGGLSVTAGQLERTLGGVAPAAVLLATDFDGTLAEVVEHPADARALPEALSALRRLVPVLGRVAVISGRSRADLERFLPVPGLSLHGDYGLGEPTASEAGALAGLAGGLEPLLARTPGAWLERKPGSATVHFREAPGAAAELERTVRELTEGRGLLSRNGRMVVEVMPERGRKERALAELVGELDPGAVLFAGDDVGDLACFELVAGLERPHLAIGVGSKEAAPGLFDACDLVLPGPEAYARLLTLLAGWARARGRAGPAAAG